MNSTISKTNNISKPALIASNLSLSLGKVQILKDICFTLNAGSLLLLLGENGAGKSMLLKTLSGYYKTYRGSVLLYGEMLHGMKDIFRARLISYVSTDFTSTFSYSVQEIIEMGRYVWLGNRSQMMESDYQKIRESMEMMDIWHLKDRNILSVSTGERMRVFTARAIATDAHIILLDEPVASLDIKHKTALYNMVQVLTENGKSIIMSLHDLNDAVQLRTACLVLSNGELVASGASDEIINTTLIEKVYGVSSKLEQRFVYSKLET